MSEAKAPERTLFGHPIGLANLFTDLADGSSDGRAGTLYELASRLQATAALEAASLHAFIGKPAELGAHLSV